MLQVIQIGLNTSDMAGSLRLYAEAFGFRNGGGQAVWGKTIGVQGLPHDSRALMWWMLSRQSFFQLELFHHTCPAQRPLPAHWLPCDHGWIRYGIEISDFDACAATLAPYGVTPITAPIEVNGLRRMAFRDPFIGVIVEIMEAGESNPSNGPKVAYVTSSVSDIESARSFYGETMALEVAPLDELHRPENEALWGLSGATRDGFVVRSGNDIALEIVQYRNPVGRPRPADYRISDQGVMNIAMSSRNISDVVHALKRVRDAGYVPPFTYDSDGIVCGYITESGREIELTAWPQEMDAQLGFLPAGDFMR